MKASQRKRRIVRHVPPAVSRLVVKPGDVLVAQFPDAWNNQSIDYLRKSLFGLPGISVMLVPASVKLSVIQPPPAPIVLPGRVLSKDELRRLEELLPPSTPGPVAHHPV